MKQEEIQVKCTLKTFHAPAFAANFSPVVSEFHQRTRRVRLRNLGTTDKKIFSQDQAQKDFEVHQDVMRKSISKYVGKLGKDI